MYRDAKRLKNGDEVRRLISEWTSSRSKTAIVAVLGGRVPCAPVNTAADIFADPHVAARQMIVPVELPGNAAPAQLCGVPTKFTRTPAEVIRRPRCSASTPRRCSSSSAWIRPRSNACGVGSCGVTRAVDHSDRGKVALSGHMP